MPRCVAALALILVAALASTASAESSPDPGAGATVVLHCVPPELAGKEVVLAVGADVDAALLVPGARLMAVIDLPAKLLVKVKAVPAGGECGPMQPPSGQPGPGKSGPGGDGDDQKTAEFRSGFINRVWKFRGSSSSFDAGVLNITVEKILNLPRKFRDQDDDVLDQDAYVLVGPKTKVFDADGHRVAQSALDDADTVVVEGKLLRPAKWKQDEDDTPVVTIRAKRIHISS